MTSKVSSTKIQGMLNENKFNAINTRFVNMEEKVNKLDLNPNNDLFNPIKKKILDLESKINALNIGKLNNEFLSQTNKYNNLIKMIDAISSEISIVKKDIKFNSPQLITKLQNDFNVIKNDMKNICNNDTSIKNLTNIVSDFKNDVNMIKENIDISNNYVISDNRIISNIQNIDTVAYFRKLNSLKLYKYKIGNDPKFGLLSDDITDNDLNIVKTISHKVNNKQFNDLKVLDYNEIIHILIGSVKQLKIENDKINRDLNLLKENKNN